MSTDLDTVDMRPRPLERTRHDLHHDDAMLLTALGMVCCLMLGVSLGFLMGTHYHILAR